MTIEKGLIGSADIAFGTGQFQRKSQSGQFITLDQIRASHVPILDSAGRFTGTEVETALAEVMTREESGSSVKKLTNKSGAQRVAGDVVIIDTSNDDSFTTTTTAGNVLVLGVVLETIESNATGKVATGGYVASVKVTGATVRGNYLKTSTTVIKAVPSTTFVQGVFAIALSNDASVVSAYIFGGIGAVDAQTLDGYNSGNGTGVIPISNSTVCTDLNSDMVDGKHYSQWTGGSRVFATKSSGVTIANNTWTKVVFDTESFDFLGDHDTATGCFLAPESGYYFITAKGQFAANATGVRGIRISEGTICGTVLIARHQTYSNNFGAGYSSSVYTNGLMYLTGGRYYWVEVYQDSGGNLTYGSGGTTDIFTIHRVDKLPL